MKVINIEDTTVHGTASIKRLAVAHHYCKDCRDPVITVVGRDHGFRITRAEARSLLADLSLNLRLLDELVEEEEEE